MLGIVKRHHDHEIHKAGLHLLDQEKARCQQSLEGLQNKGLILEVIERDQHFKAQLKNLVKQITHLEKDICLPPLSGPVTSHLETPAIQ